MALHLEFGRAGIEIIGFTRHQSGKKVDSDHKSVKHGLKNLGCERKAGIVGKKSKSQPMRPSTVKAGQQDFVNFDVSCVDPKLI